MCYDQHGITTSPRVWWLLKYFGHTSVQVLDGGLPEWIKTHPTQAFQIPEVILFL